MLLRKVSIRFIVVLMIMLFCNTSLTAQAKYFVQKNENNKLVCTHNDEEQKETYLAILYDGKSYMVVKPFTPDSVVYYFDKNGYGKPDAKNHFVEVSYGKSSKKYFSKQGKLVKNQIVGNKEQGFYYVGKDGIKVTDKTTKKAVEFVRKHTKSSDPKSVKLKKCYVYLASNYKYKRIYTVSLLYPKASDMNSIAYEMFSTKMGNCHRFGACFAYIARVLGYESQVGVGKLRSSSRLPGASGGYTPHGWAEVKTNGVWYEFDPDIDMHTAGHCSYFKRQYMGYQVTRKCRSYSKNGKIKWKNIN
ncbi:MAG: transglutaminase domain-containing protein [Eubacteriales bacterium]|nr:transglutaminase domain-containing protein [Eubacteriales bacterium]